MNSQAAALLRRLRTLIVLVGMCVPFGTSTPAANAALDPATIPLFRMRFQVRDTPALAPNARPTKPTLHVLRGPQQFTISSEGDAWSDWLLFVLPRITALAKSYPNNYLGRLPLVVRMALYNVTFPATIGFEVQFEGGSTHAFEEELSGGSAGFMVWAGADGKPLADSMAGYNRVMIWDKITGPSLDAAQRPRHFPLIDRYIGGTDDLIEWREGINHLARYGFTSIMMPPSAPMHKLLQTTDVKKTSWAVYNPPGYAFEFTMNAKERGDGTLTTQQILDAWASKLATAYTSAGYDLHDFASYTVSDEPGWYYPATLESLKQDAAGMERFRQYLKDLKFEPIDLGATSWEEVLPIGVSQATDLPHRRLFYWTMRFFSWDSSRHFANTTQALNKAFYPGILNPVNWNFFAGRFYVPGPVANNRDKKSPDAAMGGHDWFEFAQMRGSNILWTEDWFPDGMASQWSFYAAKLGPAAKHAGITWGGYVVPRVGGQTEYGMMQKVLSIIGNGGKAISYFTFGPEYNFPSNCYSTKADNILPKLAEVHGMIAKAEDLLWPGKKPQAEVAILAPRSSQLWDTNGISDATNTSMHRETVDYMMEAFDLYRSLQQENIPTDVISEDELTPQGLAGYKVLYVTEPNFPKEQITGLAQWVNDGGVLASVTGALTADRYNDPMSDFQEARGIVETARPRLKVPHATKLAKVGVLEGLDVVGVIGKIERSNGQVLAQFEDASPAVIERASGRGAYVHYTFLPGASGILTLKDGVTEINDTARKWISYPVRKAGVLPPVTVDQVNVETPILLSEKGAAITLLNWRAADVPKLNVSVRPSFTVTSVESVTVGNLSFTQKNGVISFALPLKGADIVMLKK
jgi:hypothetical protein